MEVKIRRARDSDARQLAVLRDMADVRRFQPMIPIPPSMLRRRLRQEGATSLDEERGHALTWMVIADGETAGWVSLRNIDWFSHSAGLGFSVAPWAQGKGVARAAVSEVLDLAFGPGRMQRIEADCDIDNKRSQRLLERLGFQREGTLRAFARMPGGRRDFYLYSLLADEWGPGANSAPAPGTPSAPP
ncbi:MAG: GNAT family protein [Candidatus Dormiibacterota bacterium]